jgi:hypothetical protein
MQLSPDQNRNENSQYTVDNNNWQRDSESLLVNSGLLMESVEEQACTELFGLRPIPQMRQLFEEDEEGDLKELIIDIDYFVKEFKKRHF